MTANEHLENLLEAIVTIMEMREDGKSQEEIDAFTQKVFQAEVARCKGFSN